MLGVPCPFLTQFYCQRPDFFLRAGLFWNVVGLCCATGEQGGEKKRLNTCSLPKVPLSFCLPSHVGSPSGPLHWEGGTLLGGGLTKGGVFPPPLPSRFWNSFHALIP